MEINLTFSNFDTNSDKYVDSSIHSKGADLDDIYNLLDNQKESVVIDIGAGAGHATFKAAPKVSWVISVDPSPNMLDKVVNGAKSKGLTNVVIRQGKSEKLEFNSNSSDVVITRFALHHFEDIHASLSEIHRILKDNGVFILVDTVAPEDDTLDTWLNSIELIRDVNHVRNRKPSELRSLLDEHGFTLFESKDYEYDVEFDDWTNRTSTPKEFANQILSLQKVAPELIQKYFGFKDNGDFTMNYTLLACRKKTANI